MLSATLGAVHHSPGLSTMNPPEHGRGNPAGELQALKAQCSPASLQSDVKQQKRVVTK